MALENIFPILNQMEAEGVIGRYAIGGAVGAIFWLEPMHTRDLDVFLTLPTSDGGSLLTLTQTTFSHAVIGPADSTSRWRAGWSNSFRPALHSLKKHWHRRLRAR